MKMPNYDSNNKKKDKRICDFIPEDFGAICVGPSGCGKTNVVMHMVLSCLFFDKVYVYTRTPQQEKIQNLIDIFNEISNKVGYEFLEVLPPNEIKKVDGYNVDDRKVVLFDDLLKEKIIQPIISEHYTAGRHSKISPIYLAQAYHDIPQAIGLNSSIMTSFEPQKTQHRDIIARENNFNKKIFDKVNPFEFIYVKIDDEKVAKNFDELINVM